VWRRSERRAAVLAVVDVLTTGIGDLGTQAPGVWPPADDLYRP
jgi:hypothetical protein